MTNERDQESDGPDGLGRLHDMLAAAYGTEIPDSDYPAVVLLLDDLGASSRGITELVGRFRANCDLNDIYGILSGDPRVAPAKRNRVRQLLGQHGYESLRKEAAREWSHGADELREDDPRISPELRPFWTALLTGLPDGLEYWGDYRVLLVVLNEAGLTDDQVIELVSVFVQRPAALVAKELPSFRSRPTDPVAKARIANKLGLQSDYSGEE